MAAEVEMKDAPAPSSPSKKEGNEATAKDPKDAIRSALRDALALVRKAAAAKQQRFAVQALRRFFVPSVRRSEALSADLFAELVPKHVADPSLVKTIMSMMNVSSVLADEEEKDASEHVTPVSCLVRLMVSVYLLDRGEKAKALGVAKAAMELSTSCYEPQFFDITAKIFFYYARANELCDGLDGIRNELFALYRTASLHHDDVGQATLANLLLRSYVQKNMYDMADKLLSKIRFPEGASPNQTARYLYYCGRIRAVQLDYSDAYSNLMQAQRKAPQGGALGFRLMVQKVLCLVRLLMGEIPERHLFHQRGMNRGLLPYFELTQAVRLGNLNAFEEAAKKFVAQFEADGTAKLIARLRQNVIKTGLRKINLAYSRILLADVAAKLQIDPEDAEFVAAKAIRDGVIDAVIDHSEGILRSREISDVYTTAEPQEVFAQRVRFCIDVRNDAVKAMVYPDDEAKVGELTAEERLEREREDNELAEQLAQDDEFDDDDLMDEF